MSQRPGPGLAKARRPPVLRWRTARLCSSVAGRWGELLDTADIVSEGQARDEAGTLVYYGTTSVLLRGLDREAGDPRAQRMLELDPHLRVLVVRLARREAAARAGGAIVSMRTEVTIRRLPEGLSVLVDVTARLSQRRSRTR